MVSLTKTVFMALEYLCVFIFFYIFLVWVPTANEFANWDCRRAFVYVFLCFKACTSSKIYLCIYRPGAAGVTHGSEVKNTHTLVIYWVYFLIFFFV